MAMSLEDLLTPIGGDDPAGADLAYDPQRMEIEQVFERPASRDPTGEAESAPEIEWRPILTMIEAQSRKTKDIWLPVYMCRAGARAGQLDTIVTGAQYLAGLLENMWEDIYPKLDDLGFQGRKGACDTLTSTPDSLGDFVGPLLRTPLLTHPRLGNYSGADFERFRTGGESEEGYGFFRNALMETEEESLLEIAEKVDLISEAFRRADASLSEHSEGESSTNFKGAYDTLALMKRGVLAFTSGPAEAAEEEAGEAGDSDAPRSGGGGGVVGGRIDSRDDVLKVLDAIGDYYRRKEPTSPMPLILQRAREWVAADFIAILQDIAPNSVDEVKRILMAQPKNSDY